MRFQSRPGWILPALLWLWLFLHLRQEWSLNSQYNYGWAIPFLGALILYLRWRTRPAPAPPTAPATGTIVALWLLLLVLFPIRIIEEANPDWRLLSWVLALIVAALSSLWAFQAGGTPWLRHFAFPFYFPLVAVPWPVAFENAVVQAMMGAVASIAVEIAGLAGIAAYQLGNVIQLRNGFVGVDEACSGVKTLQAGIMVALVLGELLHLGRGRRIALLVLGCAWVFFCNVIRATALVFVAATHGLEALVRWHDAIGTGALIAGLAGLFALAWCWKQEPRSPAVAASTARQIPAFPQQAFALAWIVAVFAGTEVWYRAHERKLIERPPWTVVFPTGNPSLKSLPIAESTRVILRYDDAASAQWEDPPGMRWWTFFAHWKPKRAALQLVRSHSPEICLPAIGHTFRGTQPDVTVTSGSITLDFLSYEFEQDGQPLFVFVCIQEDKRVASGPADSGEWNLRGRLQAAWLGKRNLGQRLLEVAVSGVDSFAKANEALGNTTRTIVRPKTTD